MSDKQLQREFAVARQIHAGMRGDISEVILPAPPDVPEQGRKMAIRIGVAFMVLMFVNVGIGLWFIFKHESKNPNRPLLEAQMREQIAKSIEHAASLTPAPNVLGVTEITVPAETGKLDAVADKVVAIVSELGGSATKGVPDAGRLSILVDLPASRESEFRGAIASIQGRAGISRGVTARSQQLEGSSPLRSYDCGHPTQLTDEKKSHASSKHQFARARRLEILKGLMIAVTFALPAESSEFLRRLGNKSRADRNGISIVRGTIDHRSIEVIHTGVGENICRERIGNFLENQQFDFLISAGFAGSLNHELQVNDLLLAKNFSTLDVKHAQSSLSNVSVHAANMLTVPVLIDSSEERERIARESGASAVDMETQFDCARLRDARNSATGATHHHRHARPNHFLPRRESCSMSNSSELISPRLPSFSSPIRGAYRI